MKHATGFELRPIADLIPYANNAKTHPPEQILSLGDELGITPKARKARGLIAPR